MATSRAVWMPCHSSTESRERGKRGHGVLLCRTIRGARVTASRGTGNLRRRWAAFESCAFRVRKRRPGTRSNTHESAPLLCSRGAGCRLVLPVHQQEPDALTGSWLPVDGGIRCFHERQTTERNASDCLPLCRHRTDTRQV
jgi:hypothetical protein